MVMHDLNITIINERCRVNREEEFRALAYRKKEVVVLCERKNLMTIEYNIKITDKNCVNTKCKVEFVNNKCAIILHQHKCDSFKIKIS